MALIWGFINLFTKIITFFFIFPAAGDIQIQTGGLEIISETKSPITGLGFEKIETNPNYFQTLTALLSLRTLRLVRDLQKLYFMILLPLAFATGSLYLNRIQNIEPKIKPLVLNGSTYGNWDSFAIHNASGENIDPFLIQLGELDVDYITMYNGNFSLLLDISPNMAALNVNVFKDPEYNFTVIYNDTAQHSLPILINLISNAMYR